MLGKAATSLSEALGEEKMRIVWATAYDVHVWGFRGIRRGVGTEHLKSNIALCYEVQTVEGSGIGVKRHYAR